MVNLVSLQAQHPSLPVVNPSLDSKHREAPPQVATDTLEVPQQKGVFNTIYEKMCNGCTWVKDWVVSILSKIFFCDYSKESERTSDSKIPIDSQIDMFCNLRCFFLENHQKYNFVDLWKEKFDQLPSELQEKILERDMKGWAKEDKTPNFEAYVQEHLKEDSSRTFSLNFVRNLVKVPKPDDLPNNNNAVKIFDPIQDVPSYLSDIIEDLEKEAEKEA